MAPRVQRSVLASAALLLGGAEAFCKWGFTCCCGTELGFFRERCKCVQNKPSGLPFGGKNQCDAYGVDAVTVPLWYKALSHKVDFCPSGTPVVTEGELQRWLKQVELWDAGYQKYCRDGEAHCASTENCYFNREAGPNIFTDVVPKRRVAEMGPVCRCEFGNGRNSSGQCVDCHGHFLMEGFHNDERHCAAGYEKQFEVWHAGYTKYCIDGEAHCAKTEDCFFNRQDSPDRVFGNSVVAEMGPVCRCGIAGGRNSAGQCVDCHGQVVLDEDGEPKLFHNDEVHCAAGHGGTKAVVV